MVLLFVAANRDF